MDWCFREGTKFKRSHYHTVKRAAEAICDRVSYAKMRGRPVLWDLRPEVRELSLWGLRRWLQGKT
jgi:hypothetical protein